MSRIRVGLIGCGGIAAGHAQRLLNIPEAELGALCDIDPQAFDRLYKRVPGMPELPTFADYRQMLEAVPLDAVQVLTPHTLHFEQTMDSLKQGLHVLVEKPMVCTTEHAMAVIDEMHTRKKVVLVSYQRHYQGGFRFIRELLASGSMGEVQYVSALQGQDWLKNTRGTWRQEPELSGGGQMNDSGSHLLDIILWTTGLEPYTVHATCENFNAPVDINTALSVVCTNGAQLSISIVGNSAEWREDITIWTEHGVIYYRNGHMEVKMRGQKEALKPPGQPDEDNPDRNLINAILGRDTVKSRPEDALKVIQLTETAWHSSSVGAPVSMSDFLAS